MIEYKVILTAECLDGTVVIEGPVKTEALPRAGDHLTFGHGILGHVKVVVFNVQSTTGEPCVIARADETNRVLKKLDMARRWQSLVDDKNWSFYEI